MADLTEHLLQDCVNCGAQIDVSDEEPFAQMHCPACGAAMRVRRQFGSFELEEILGAGGMGAVYRAMDTNLHRPVALKLLRREYSANPEFIRQFAHEAAITASINHPNVVKVYSSGSDHGLFYIAMELVDKGSLDDLMTLETKVGEMQVLDVGIQIAQGLNAAYQQGLIHRDVKPGNILFADAQTAKIVDFGLAVPMHEAGTLGGEIWGTPYYVAPEKLDNKPEDFRSDMFSLAASLFHAASGRPPHDTDETSITALKKAKSRVVSIQTYAPEISNATAYVINRALHPNPDRRYSSYKDFIEHLQYAKEELRQKSAKLRARNKPVQPPRAVPANRNWAALGMIAALLLGAVVLFLLRDQIFRPVTSNETKSVVSDAGETTQEIEILYRDARTLIAQGKYAEAMEQFSAVISNVLTPEHTRTWAAAHLAVASTLAGDPVRARETWTQLAERGLFSDKPEELKLAQWFVETAQFALTDEELPADLTERYSRSNYEPFALFALGLNRWALGQLESAASLLQSFVDSTPEGGNDWLNRYKPIASAHLADWALYRQLMQQATASADKPEQQPTTLAALKEGLQRLKLQGPHRQELAELVTSVEQQIAARSQEDSRRLAEQEGSDLKALSDVQPKIAALMAKYRFSEARAQLAGVQVQSEKGRLQKERMMRRIEGPGAFKVQLIRDVSAVGYAVPVLNRAGGKLPGVVTRANDQQLEFTSEFGGAPVPWTDVSVESLLQMAKSFIPQDSAPQSKADREWLIATFAHFTGRAQEAKTLFKSAASARPDYKVKLESFYPDVVIE